MFIGGLSMKTTQGIDDLSISIYIYIYIYRQSLYMQIESLRAHFEKYGEVSDCMLLMDKSTGTHIQIEDISII